MNRQSSDRLSSLPVELLQEILELLDYPALKFVSRLNKRWYSLLGGFDATMVTPKIKQLLFRDPPKAIAESIDSNTNLKYRIHPALCNKARTYINRRYNPVEYYSRKSEGSLVWSEHCTSPSVTKILLFFSHCKGAERVEHYKNIGLEICNSQGVTTGDVVDGIIEIFCKSREVEKFPVMMHPATSSELPIMGFTDTSNPPWFTASKPCVIWGVQAEIEAVWQDQLDLACRWVNILYKEPPAIGPLDVEYWQNRAIFIDDREKGE